MLNLLRSWFLLVCLVLLSTACGNQPQYTIVPAKSTVVILGDSLTYGTGANKGEDYASILAANTGWNIINAGVPGNTSLNGLERMPAILQEHEIDLLIIELGGNDFLQRLPEQETVNNLQAILAQAKAKRIQTILLAVPEFSPMGAAFGNLSDHALYAKLAQESDIPLIENVFTDVLATNALKADSIHPNAEGYVMVEANLRQSLIKLGFLK
jgi:acyl-CoA hydrolase